MSQLTLPTLAQQQQLEAEVNKILVKRKKNDFFSFSRNEQFLRLTKKEEPVFSWDRDVQNVLIFKCSTPCLPHWSPLQQPSSRDIRADLATHQRSALKIR